MPLLPIFRRSEKVPNNAGAIELTEPSKQDGQPDSSNIDNQQQPPWKALFYFTTRSHLSCLIVGLFSAVISGVASPAQSLLIGKAFGAFTSSKTGDDLVRQETRYLLIMLGVGIGSWLTHFIFFSAWVTFGELQANSARERLFSGMLEKEMEWYDLRKHGVGALIPRLQAQIRELQLATAQPFGSLVTGIASAAFNFGLALYFSWKLTLVVVATTPLITIVVGLLSATMQPKIEKQTAKMNEAIKYATSALTLIETVKCSNGQEEEVRKYSSAINESASWYYGVVNANALQLGFTQFMATAMFVQGFYYGGVLIRNGEKKVSDVITTFVAAIGAFQAISGFLPQMIVLEKGRTAGATLRAVMSQMLQGPSTTRTAASVRPGTCEGNIVFKDISFAYPARPNAMVLKDINMFIPAGVTTFVIGKSGSGKSTVGQLLMRFYHPTHGEISFDGQPIASLNAEWLRSNITLVEQQSILFDDTVFVNIALGRGDPLHATKNEIVRAAEFSLLQLMIRDMPQGLKTRVGGRGVTMSGGQRQRMALARAYLRDSKVLILDESTSALDQVSRSLMIDAIREWRRGRTTVIITHDISQIGPNDYALVLERGRVVQEGYRKHMQKIKGSPFQDFLSPDEQAQLSPFDARRHTSAELSIRSRSVDPDAFPIGDTSPVTYDPLDAHLNAGERSKDRMSFLPSFLANDTTRTILQVAYRFGGPMQHFKSQAAKEQFHPASPKSDRFSRDRSEDSRLQQQHANDARQWQAKETNWAAAAPNLMDKILDRTGALAVSARIGTGHRTKQRLDSESSIAYPEHTNERYARRKGRHILEYRRSRAEAAGASISDILRTIWPSIDWPTRIVLVVGFTFAAIVAASTPVFSFLLSKLIATYTKGQSGKAESLKWSMAVLGIAGASAFSTYSQHLLLEFVGQRWVDSVRQTSMSRLLDQPCDFFLQDENAVSTLTENLDRHAEEMRNLLGRFAALVFTATVMIITSMTWAIITQWKLTLITLSLAPYVYAVTRLFGKVSGRWEGKSNDAAEVANAIMTETFTNIKTVRALTLESYFGGKYRKATSDTLVVGMKRALYSGFFYGLSDSSATLVTGLILYIGARLVKDGVPTGKVIEVFVQLTVTITNITNILAFIPQMSSSRDTASRVLRLAQLPQDSHEHHGNTRITSIGDIVFTDLTFCYPSRPDQAILHGINVMIPAGSSTVIVGSSGSGKSTIAAILLKLYATSASKSNTGEPVPEVTFSGRDLKHIHTPTLRSLVSIVSQTPALFPASIADNIVYGLPANSPYRGIHSIRQAAAAAGLDDFIATLPTGYDTLVGDGGTGLSGGQIQRIAIARALVRRPAVLILDEATSALDVENAALVRATVKNLLERDGTGMTVIIITHNREMMELADNVVVLDQGRVVETGSFKGLLTKHGALANLLNGGEWAPGSEGDEKVVSGSTAVRGMTGIVDWTGEGGGMMSPRSKGPRSEVL